MLRSTGRRKCCLYGVSPGYDGKAPPFGSVRRRYVGRGAAIGEYRVNSRSNLIQNNEAISTLKSKMYHKYKIIEPNDLKRLSCNELNFLYRFLHLTVFCRRKYLPLSRYLSVYGEQKSCSQHLQSTHSILLPFFVF